MKKSLTPTRFTTNQLFLILLSVVVLLVMVFLTRVSIHTQPVFAQQQKTVSISERSPLTRFFFVIGERYRALLRQLIQHIQLTLYATILAIAVGVTTGILLTRFSKFATPVLGVTSVIQTIPSLALLALMIPLLGIGLVPAVAALFLYALLPIMRNTYTAIEEVDPAVIEVGKGMGMTDWQILFKVQIPLCVPMVMAGIRTSTVICVGIATLCTFIGAGGLGTIIMEGMQTRGSTLIFAGVIPAILLALILDGLMALSQKLLTPRGLKVSDKK